MEECVKQGGQPGSIVKEAVRQQSAIDPVLVDTARRTERPAAELTKFGGSGVDPWTASLSANQHSNLTAEGINGDNWMWRMARQTRDLDAAIREERENRFVKFDDEDVSLFPRLYPAERPARLSAASKEQKRDLGYLEPTATSLARIYPNDRWYKPDPESLKAKQQGVVVIEDRKTTIEGRNRPRLNVQGKVAVFKGVYEVSQSGPLGFLHGPHSTPLCNKSC